MLYFYIVTLVNWNFDLLVFLLMFFAIALLKILKNIINAYLFGKSQGEHKLIFSFYSGSSQAKRRKWTREEVQAVEKTT